MTSGLLPSTAPLRASATSAVGQPLACCNRSAIASASASTRVVRIRIRVSASTKQSAATFQTRRRPQLLAVVILLKCRYARRQLQPGLLRAHVDVHVGRERGGRVERADTHEAQLRSSAILAPYGNLTVWA